MPDRPHLLLVDDERSIREPLASYLQKNGFRVTAVGDAKAARAALAGYAIDLVVLDIMMPVLDGWFVLAELAGRSHRPCVVVCSAKSSDADRNRAKELSADEYVTKPFEPDHLVAVIREVLGRRARAARV